MSGVSLRQIVTGLLALVVCAGFVALVLAIQTRGRKRRAKIVESFVGRFGVVQVASTWRAVHVVLAKPSWGGLLRVHGGGSRLFEHIEFTGTTSKPCRPWSINSRRYAAEPKGAPVPDPGDEVWKHFLVRAERPEEVRAFFDEAMQRTLVELDAGIWYVLIGGLAGIRASVCGAMVNVMVTGATGDEEAHLARALALIERMSHHAAGAQTAVAEVCAACGEGVSEPAAPAPCERCGARHHAACWGRLGVCCVWGCGDRNRLLDVIERRYFAHHRFFGLGMGSG